MLKIAQIANRKISFLSTFSLINKKYEKANKHKAPITLNKINPEGIIKLGITSFAKVKLIA